MATILGSVVTGKLYLGFNPSGAELPLPNKTPLTEETSNRRAPEFARYEQMGFKIRDVIGMSDSTLILVGLAGKGTGRPVEWSEAVNTAAGLQVKARIIALACSH